MLFLKYSSDVWAERYDLLKEQHGDDLFAASSAQFSTAIRFVRRSVA